MDPVPDAQVAVNGELIITACISLVLHFCEVLALVTVHRSVWLGGGAGVHITT